VLLAAAALGLFSGRGFDAGPLQARLDRAEEQLRALAAAPAPAAIDPKAMEDVAARVTKIEAALAAPRAPVTDPAVANRIALLEGEVKALAERIGVLGRRSDEIAAMAGEARASAKALASALAELKASQSKAGLLEQGDIDPLARRIVALEKSAKAMQVELDRRRGDSGADRSLRLVVVANALNAAVESGRPYAAELAAAKALADPNKLAPLDPYAKAGVPSAEMLSRELLLLLPSLTKAIGTSRENGGFLDRLQANARKIVRVRPVDEVPGDDPQAILARIETRAEKADLAGVLADFAKLPEAARAPAKAWIAKVEARAAAIALSRGFAASALAAIGKPAL
jgi:hypothetical protein